MVLAAVQPAATISALRRIAVLNAGRSPPKVLYEEASTARAERVSLDHQGLIAADHGGGAIALADEPGAGGFNPG